MSAQDVAAWTDPVALAGYAAHAAEAGVPDADERLAEIVLAVARQ